LIILWLLVVGLEVVITTLVVEVLEGLELARDWLSLLPAVMEVVITR